MPSKPKRKAVKGVVRDEKGRFDYKNSGLICKCGHKLGIHAGENPRPCFNEDTGAGGTGEHCPCKAFDIARKPKYMAYCWVCSDTTDHSMDDKCCEHLIQDDE